ncbi:hypothetical protein FE257_004106 [Aspergillus nanangensis]|uniref:chitinase n=1 Tax=Aspergillus nanangensis TaxID=2582783 RepID=A0AAD4CC24_ASPNN|nr:hypothetical protein FE257_004106 [Aspergillus nanangensis]
MLSSKTWWLVKLFLTLIVQAKLDLSSQKNIAIYWGQNSYAHLRGEFAQQDLAYYCQQEEISVIQIAFLTGFKGPGGGPTMDLSSAGSKCTTFSGTSLLSCPQIAKDIKICQSLGKTILLSIGGEVYSEGGFGSEADAVAAAKLIWQTFGPETNSSVDRPFGDAVIDGFDIDIESTASNLPKFAKHLRSYYALDTTKTYYLTAAPQCPYPDAAQGPMLDGFVSFDAIWVQFYNNYCGLQSYVPGSHTQENFNFHVWDQWAKNISLNKDVKVFLGIPGNSGAAGSGYVSVSDLSGIIEYVKGFSSFGGVMIWDASQAYANSGLTLEINSTLMDGSSFSVAGAKSLKATKTEIFPNTDPLKHPAFAEKWADTLPDRLLTYSRDHPEFTKLQAWERDGYYQKKSVNDYKHLMGACYGTGAKYIAMIEDDTLAVKGWLGPTLQALNAVEERTPDREWMYLRLFYTESLLGWNSEEWPQYLFWSFVVWASSTATMIAAKKWLKTPNLLASSIVWTVSCILVPATISIHFILGRQTMWPIPSGVHEMNRYGCCSQGLIFPHFIIPRVLDLANPVEDSFVDMMLENIADSEGLSRFVVVPSIFQHIGWTSSKGYGFDSSARSLWNFRFEKYPPSGI